MTKLRSAFREFLGDYDKEYIEFLTSQGWLNPESGGPLGNLIEPLLQPYLKHEAPIPQENLQKILRISSLGGAVCEALGRFSAALDWYRIGQYEYRGRRVYSRHINEDIPDISAREDAGSAQEVAAVCADRVGNRERARQFYEWAAQNYSFSDDEMKWYEKSRLYMDIWERLSSRAYALVCLEQWEQALSVAEQGQYYLKKDRDVDTTFTPVVLYPIVHALATYKITPSDENRRKAIEMFSLQSVATRNDVGHLWGLFYLYNLRARHPELVEPPVSHVGWAKQAPSDPVIFTHPASVSALAFSSTSDVIAAGLTDGQVWLWRVDDWKKQAQFNAHPNAIRSLAFSTEGRLLATGANRAYSSEEPNLRLWQAENGRLLHDLKGHTDCVTGVAFTVDQQLQLISVSDDTTIRVWGVENGIQQEQWQAEEMMSSLALGNDQVAMGESSFHGRILLWNLKNGKKLILEAHKDSLCLDGSEEPYPEHGVTGLAISSDSSLLAAGLLDGTVLIFDLGKKKKKPRILETHEFTPVLVAFAPKEETLIAAGDKTLNAWSARDGEPLWEYKAKEEITSLSVSPDGKWLAIGLKDGVVEVHACPK